MNQGDRFMLFIFFLTFAAMLWGMSDDIQNLRPVGVCSTEDEISIQILEDSFEYEAGNVLCLHVDYLRGNNE